MAERDAYIAELDGERRELGRLREATRRAERARRQGGGGRARDAQAAGRGRGAGRAAARGRDAAGRGVGAPPAPTWRRCSAEIEKLKQKEADARAEAWKALKQRADAEAAAAEVREDTVRKLKDARKLASVELTRATEEAMKKAVTLKEELARTERERKELIAEVKRLNGELETARSRRRRRPRRRRRAPAAARDGERRAGAERAA